jgi:DNA-binding HxlR family transcriptional regulator
MIPIKRRGIVMSPARASASRNEVFLRYPGSSIVIALLADKWTIPVVHALARGTRRTGELKKALAGVSQKMLTQTLRMLEEHSLVERKVYPVVPPRVEYSLTAMGRSINEPLAELYAWTEANGQALEQGRARRSRRRATEQR